MNVLAYISGAKKAKSRKDSSWRHARNRTFSNKAKLRFNNLL